MILAINNMISINCLTDPILLVNSFILFLFNSCLQSNIASNQILINHSSISWIIKSDPSTLLLLIIYWFQQFMWYFVWLLSYLLFVNLCIVNHIVLIGVFSDYYIHLLLHKSLYILQWYNLLIIISFIIKSLIVEYLKINYPLEL